MLIVWRGFAISMLPMMGMVTVHTSLFVHSHLVFVVYPTYICIFDALKYDLMMDGGYHSYVYKCANDIRYTALAFQGVGVSQKIKKKK